MAIRQLAQLSLADAVVSRRGKSSVTLERLDRLVDWSAVAALLSGVHGSRFGAPGYPPLCLLKALLLQQWYALSDPALEDALADRLSFRRFVGLALDAPVPDHSTLSRFRSLLAAQGLTGPVFREVTRQIDERGLILRNGTMIDASLVEAAVKRPPKPKASVPEAEPPAPETPAPETPAPETPAPETAAARPAAPTQAVVPEPDPRPEPQGEDAATVACEAAPESPGEAEPSEGQGAKGEPKAKRAPSNLVGNPLDPDATWAKKGAKRYFGYKAHVGVDHGSGIIRRAKLTTASVADTTPADDLIIGDEAAVYGDKAYDTKARRARLKSAGIKDRIAHRPNRHHPLTPRQEQRNAGISRLRSGVERIFSGFKEVMKWRRVRYRGLERNAAHLDLMCTAANLSRLLVLSA